MLGESPHLYFDFSVICILHLLLAFINYATGLPPVCWTMMLRGFPLNYKLSPSGLVHVSICDDLEVRTGWLTSPTYTTSYTFCNCPPEHHIQVFSDLTTQSARQHNLSVSSKAFTHHCWKNKSVLWSDICLPWSMFPASENNICVRCFLHQPLCLLVLSR